MQNSSTAHAGEMSRLRDGLRVGTHLYLGAGVVFLIGMLVASYMQASSGLRALQEFGIMSQRADHLGRLNQQLLDAMNSARGYALTDDPRYLTAYEATSEKIHTSLAVIKQDHQSDGSANLAGLIQHAHTLAARIDLTVRNLRSGAVPQKAWFDQSTMAMQAYQHKHNLMKVELLTSNLENVKQSVKGFENARISAILLAIASLLLLLLAISQKQKRQALLERIRNMLEADNERLEREVRLRTTELTNLATYLTEVREEEKLYLARELHDELGALLTAAKLDADWIERNLPPESQAIVAQRMVRLRQSLTGGITLKRRIINDLRPVLLHDLGLMDALRALIEEFSEASEIKVKADLPDGDPDLSETVSLSLFRIVQEAFTNIRKYAQAKQVTVAMTVSDKIELLIQDDGIGFDPDSPILARHGLAGIKHRVFTHNGNLTIRTAPGAGVTIRVELPL